MDMNLGLADLVARLEEAIGKKMMNVVFWVFVIWVLATLVWNTLKVILDISDTASEWGPWGQIAYTVVLYAAVLVVSWGLGRWMADRQIRRIEKFRVELQNQIEKNAAEARAQIDEDSAYLEERHKRWIAAYREFKTLVFDFKKATGGQVSLKSVVAELEDQDDAPPRN